MFQAYRRWPATVNGITGGAGNAGRARLDGRGRAARAEPLGDLLGDLAAGQVGGEQAGRGDRAGGAGAVGDDHGPAQAQQDGAAVALRIQPRGQLAQAAPLQEGAEPRGRGGGHRGPQLGRGEPDRAFQRLQRHVPGEAVGHDHVDLPGQQVTALHVAREGQRERAVRRIGGQQLVCPPGELVALAGFGPDGEQPHPRGADAQRELGVGHPELAELHEHLRLGVGGGPGVDEHRAAGPGRQHHGQPRPRHVGQRPQPQPGGGDHAGGRAGRHHRRRVAAPDQLAGHGHARPRAPQAGQRALVHGQVVLGGHDGHLARPRPAWSAPAADARQARSAGSGCRARAGRPARPRRSRPGRGRRPWRRRPAPDRAPDRARSRRDGPPPGPRLPSRRAGFRCRRARPRLCPRPAGPRAVAPDGPGPCSAGHPRGFRPGMTPHPSFPSANLCPCDGPV